MVIRGLQIGAERDVPRALYARVFLQPHWLNHPFGNFYFQNTTIPKTD
jgi:hypothetical protein